MSDFMDGVNKWVSDNPLGAKVLEQQSRIEQLERELVAERDMVHQLAGDLGDALSELAAEKALADRLAAQLQGWWDCSDTFPWRDDEDREALAAHRKARGL